MNDLTQQQKFRDQQELNTKQRAALLGLEYFDTRGVAKNMPLVTGVLDNSEMYKNHLTILHRTQDGQSIAFGITSSTPQPTLRDLRKRFESNSVIFVLISQEGWRELMQRYDPPKEITYDDVKIAAEGDSATLEQVSQTLESVKSDEILEYLIEQADKIGASDIHIECQRSDVRIRMRVDGALHPVARISHDKHRVLQQSIASKANISTASDDAQTGHLQHEATREDGSHEVLNMRIETVPTVFGQDAVIRLFTFDESFLNIENLGLSEKERKNIEEIVSHPHGMVLLVGPTGSGKSTTLYSIINALNKPDIKILTLEDPVEYSIPGVVQIPVNTRGGDSFKEKLKAVLRLDPDVVMVGEIRDVDTAKTAIQASLTGHLVLATFHADTASAALSRMIDLLDQNPIFSTAIRMIIGQRLVRRLDDNTKTTYEPDEQTVKWIKDELQGLPKDTDPLSPKKSISLYKPGKSEDNPFGYKGRMLIMEQMVMSDKILKFVRGGLEGVTTSAIEKTAREDGMITIRQSGLLKAFEGTTTIEEINRVI